MTSLLAPSSLARFIIRILLMITVASAPLQAKWWIAESEHITFISNARKAEIETKHRELWEARLALKLVFPNLSSMEGDELLFIFPGNAKTFQDFSLAKGRRMNNSVGYFTQDSDGHFAMISDIIDDEVTRRTTIHEYIHFLTKDQKTPPSWLNEGIAELFSSIYRNSSGRLIIGEPVVNNIRYLLNEKMMPFSTLLAIDNTSPEYHSGKHKGVLYTQSYLFVHYLMFGDNDIPPDDIKAFLQNAFRTPATKEEDLIKYLGKGYDELEDELLEYIRVGNFNRLALDMSQEESNYQPLTFREATPVEVDSLYARVSLQLKDTNESESLMRELCQRWPNDPQIKAYWGKWLLQAERYAESAQTFQEILETGFSSPTAHIGYAISHFFLNAKKIDDETYRLGRNDTLVCLKHLFQARDLGADRRPTVYEWIAFVWLSSEVQPQDKHMAIVHEGWNKFPGSPKLANSLARYYQSTDREEEAKRILQESFLYLSARDRAALIEARKAQLLGDYQ